jgi:hypothetical protein
MKGLSLEIVIGVLVLFDQLIKQSLSLGIAMQLGTRQDAAPFT